MKHGEQKIEIMGKVLLVSLLPIICYVPLLRYPVPQPRCPLPVARSSFFLETAIRRTREKSLIGTFFVAFFVA